MQSLVSLLVAGDLDASISGYLSTIPQPLYCWRWTTVYFHLQVQLSTFFYSCVLQLFDYSGCTWKIGLAKTRGNDRAGDLQFTVSLALVSAFPHSLLSLQVYCPDSSLLTSFIINFTPSSDSRRENSALVSLISTSSRYLESIRIAN